MRVPPSLDPLVEMGIIQEVVRPLMSGKEAQLYIVVAGGVERVAKVYKDATMRSFKQRTDYTDGRKVRNSRDRRAMNKRTRHGRDQDEAAWRSAEVDAIYRLRDAGVRVPTPFNFMEGVLVMDLVTDKDGMPAPRLGDLTFSAARAQDVYDEVLQQVVRMLCAGVVHGDLSDFNILMGADGPVIIDFPQAVDPASNSVARSLLIRDIDNLHRFLSRFSAHPRRPYAQEMWALFERNELTPQTQLRGQFRDTRGKANTRDVLGLIGDAERDARKRRPQGGGRGGPQSRGQRGRGQGRGGAPATPQIEVLVRSAGRTHVVQEASKPAEAGSEPRRGNRRGGAPRGGGNARGGNAGGAKARGGGPRGADQQGQRQGQGQGQGQQHKRASQAQAAGAHTPADARGNDGAPADPAKKRRRRRRRRGGAPSSGTAADTATPSPRRR